MKTKQAHSRSTKIETKSELASKHHAGCVLKEKCSPVLTAAAVKSLQWISQRSHLHARMLLNLKTAVESGWLAEHGTASALSDFVRRTNRCAFTKSQREKNAATITSSRNTSSPTAVFRLKTPRGLSLALQGRDVHNRGCSVAEPPDSPHPKLSPAGAKLSAHHTPTTAATGTFRFYFGDIENREFVANLFAENNFSAVINLAARAGVRHSIENPFVYMTTNHLGTLNLLETMRQHNVKKFILASTSSLYAGQPLPFLETLPVNTPTSPYAASKKAAEITAYTYHKLYAIDTSILRYFTVFGPAGRPDMAIYRFIQNIATDSPIEIYGDGSQTRDFTYVEDIARGTIAALKPLGYEIINLGGGQTPFSINETIRYIEERLNKKATRLQKPKNEADMETTAADITKAKNLLNWHPQTPFLPGLEKTIAWHRRHATGGVARASRP
jgi:nucleoside-diphosphate-sugar epimerase